MQQAENRTRLIELLGLPAVAGGLIFVMYASGFIQAVGADIEKVSMLSAIVVPG